MVVRKTANDLTNDSKDAIVTTGVDHPSLTSGYCDRNHPPYQIEQAAPAVNVVEAAASFCLPKLANYGVGLASDQEDIAEVSFIVRPASIAFVTGGNGDGPESWSPFRGRIEAPRYDMLSL
jgi:hypothetical protein